VRLVGVTTPSSAIALSNSQPSSTLGA
jgi:hypothetical protein